MSIYSICTKIFKLFTPDVNLEIASLLYNTTGKPVVIE